MASAAGTHYDALGLHRSATSDEVKAAYKAAALRLHPDKQVMGGGSCKEDFARVQKAWEVLRNPVSKASYDSHLSLQQTADSTPISEELDLEDMEERMEHGAYVFSYPCRCGSVYEISEAEFSESATSVIVGCRSCSLYVKIAYCCL